MLDSIVVVSIGTHGRESSVTVIRIQEREWDSGWIAAQSKTTSRSVTYSIMVSSAIL